MIKRKARFLLFGLILITSCLMAKDNKKYLELKNIDIIEKIEEKQVLKVIEKELEKIPGGTNIVDLDSILTSKASLYNVLSIEPGVIMQEFFGANDQPRINIRGSGIQSNPVNKGINFLYDGLSINQPDGSFVIGLIDPQQHKAISVFRGANAMKYGSASLGGAINFIPRTGFNSDSFIELQGASHNMRNLNLGVGGIVKKLDYYISTGYSESDGFRANSDSERKSFALNFGYQINDKLENRTLFNYVNSYFHIPMPLQKELLKKHPTAVMGDGYAEASKYNDLMNVHKRKPHRESEQFRISNKTTFKVDDKREYQAAIYAEKLDDSFVNPHRHRVTQSKNIGINLSNKVVNPFFDTDSYELSLSYNKGSMPTQYYVNSEINGSRAYKFADFDTDASNLAINFQYNIDITKNIQLVSDLQYLRSTREVSGPASIPNSTQFVNLDKEFSYNALNPKIGLIIKTSEQSNLYTNISKSTEVPTFDQLIYDSSKPFTRLAPLAGAALVDLDEQKATTYEIGTRGIWNNLSWQASYYYSKVKDELISQVDKSGINGNTFNYTDTTTHQGIELGLSSILINNIFHLDDNLLARVIYNYNDFKFDGGVYKGNQIAGIPKQTIFFELEYNLGDYFLIAPNIKIQPDSNYADHLNTLKQDSFHLLGLKLAYNPKSNLSIYMNFNNLADKTYSSTYAIRSKSTSDLPTFLPGDGFNYSFGLKYTF